MERLVRAVPTWRDDPEAMKRRFIGNRFEFISFLYAFTPPDDRSELQRAANWLVKDGQRDLATYVYGVMLARLYEQYEQTLERDGLESAKALWPQFDEIVRALSEHGLVEPDPSGRGKMPAYLFARELLRRQLLIERYTPRVG